MQIESQATELDGHDRLCLWSSRTSRRTSWTP